uniref:NADH-ubiquinone oxidoreductase chain 4 n=1 Tax=Neobenedenia melleni TaxID=280695 RepID=A0A096VGU2_9PLAT|nr:NADH dehydrogenase subunit 4 [Neobenedenia melleni]
MKWGVFNILNYLLVILFFFFFNNNSFCYCNSIWNINEFTLFLSFIPLIFYLLLFNVLSVNNSNFNFFLIYLSILSSIICFNLNHTLLFWCFYELSILPLLFLLVIDSPYSERYLAIWYLLGYIMITSLPMLLCIFFICYDNNFCFQLDGLNNYNYTVNFILFVLFITKVPLPPFHSWLPIVHAEANSFVSIMLSGYIMKLGLIGIYRFNNCLLQDLNFYIFFIFLFSLFFLFNSMQELDSKRWLAFLSLSHILISLVGLYNQSWLEDSIVSFFCLGHGISACLLFYMFLNLYNLTGSRNWLIFYNSNTNSTVFRFLVVTSIITLVSFPPTIQFISEVLVLVKIYTNSSLLMIYSFYLFIGGLIPVLLLSYFLSNNNNTINLNLYYMAQLIMLLLLVYCFFFGIYI